MPKKKIKEGQKVTKKRVVRAADRAVSRLSITADRDIALLKESIIKLENKIVKLANELRTSDLGLLLGPRVNLKQTQELHKQLTLYLDATYGEAVKRHVYGYKKVSEWILDNFEDVEISASFTSIDKQMMTQLRKQAIIGFTDISNKAKTRITEALYQSIAAQSPFEDLVNTISAELTGRLSKSGRPLISYAEQYANDGIMNFYNTVQVEKGRAIGIKHFLYVGNIQGNTRDFCRKRVGKAYTIAQINSWKHKWQGKSGPAITHRGGYNCRHHWQPVKKEWFDKIKQKYGK